MTNRNQLTQGQAIALADYLRQNVEMLQGLTYDEAARLASTAVGEAFNGRNVSGMLKALNLRIKPERPAPPPKPGPQPATDTDDLQYLANVVAEMWAHLNRTPHNLVPRLPDRLVALSGRRPG